MLYTCGLNVILNRVKPMQILNWVTGLKTPYIGGFKPS